MLQACLQIFPVCIGAIGAAAPCDFRPKNRYSEKIKKCASVPLSIDFVATPDVFAELGKIKRPGQWLVPFALETVENAKNHALEKLCHKNGDLIILNGPQAMLEDQIQVEILDRTGTTLAIFCGPKKEVAVQILHVIQNLELNDQPTWS